MADLLNLIGPEQDVVPLGSSQIFDKLLETPKKPLEPDFLFTVGPSIPWLETRIQQDKTK